MKKIALPLILLALQAHLHAQGRPEGYATRSANGAFAITGGGSGPVVKVSTEAALEEALGRTGPVVIQVTGHINGNNQFDVESNKTIVGWGDVKVGGAGHLKGVGFVVRNGAGNVIFRNLIISHVNARNKDAITLDEAHHVWVDHCEFFSDNSLDKDYYDGLVDLSHGADFITLSWNYFHDHWKASLVGHSDNNSAEDAGKLRVTYHHNYFKNINSRMPSLRFGTGHVFNNYYDNVPAAADYDAKTVISSRMGACVRAEYNRSLGMVSSVLTEQTGPGAEAGKVQLIGNDFSGTVAASPTCQLTVPYAYEHILMTVNNAVAAVVAKAGATLANPLDFTAAPVSVESARPEGAGLEARVRKLAQGVFVQAHVAQPVRVEWYALGGTRVLRSEAMELQPGWNALRNPPAAAGSYVYALRGVGGPVAKGILVLP